MTEDGTPCSKWNAEPIRDFGLNLNQHPLLGAHPFCRNPGGLRDRPWCFIEGATSVNDWKYCNVPTAKDTCTIGKL